MKKLIFLLLISISSFAQQPMNEKDAIEKSHIDFSKQYLFFVIHGTIEIDGHQFKNDDSKNPIIYKANLDEVSIQDTLNKIEYTHRNCGVDGCKIVHLNRKEPPTAKRGYPFFYNGNELNLPLTLPDHSTLENRY